MASNIYMNDITTSTTETYVDLSSVKDIKLRNLDATNNIVVCWDASNATASEVITLTPSVDDTDEENGSYVELPKGAKGGLLYYDASAGTPVLRITGIRQ